MKSSLLNYLVCAACQGPLHCQVEEEDRSLPWREIFAGRLICENCNQVYRIHNGIPRMVTGQLSNEVRQTVEGFGWEWIRFNDHLQDTYMTDKAHFLDFIYPTTEDFFADKVVLDAGCGMGRFLKLGAEFGSRDIIGVDLSRSVEAAYRNTRTLPNAHVVQADISSLPFTKIFDYIFSIGVLHHMQHPEEGFNKLSDLLKENARISVWVYAQEHNKWITHILSPLRVHVISKLPKIGIYFISHLLGICLYSIIKLIYKPANENKSCASVKRFLPYNDYLYYNARLTYTSLVSIIFDHLVPQLADYISRQELEDWFRGEKLTAVAITPRNNMSWRGQGTRSGDRKTVHKMG